MPLTERGTHDVLNQPPPFEDVNYFDADVALREALVAGLQSFVLNAVGAREHARAHA